MVTLFSQQPRNYLDVNADKIEDFLDIVSKLSEKYKIPTNEIIYSFEVLELRRKNDLFVQNGDVFDEQMAGFGELLKDLNEAVETIAQSDDKEYLDFQE